MGKWKNVQCPENKFYKDKRSTKQIKSRSLKNKVLNINNHQKKQKPYKCCLIAIKKNGRQNQNGKNKKRNIYRTYKDATGIARACKQNVEDRMTQKIYETRTKERITQSRPKKTQQDEVKQAELHTTSS